MTSEGGDVVTSEGGDVVTSDGGDVVTSSDRTVARERPDDETGEPALVSVERVSKQFGRVVGIEDVSIEIYENEILAIVGDNGAGKSTLMNVLAGVYRPTSGTVTFDGERVAFTDPSDARQRGIEVVYQDLALMDDLDIATNVFMGKFPARLSVGPLTIIDWKRTYAEAGEILAFLGQELDLKTEVEFLSGGQRQLVAVARALLFDPELILFDEPTSALSVAGTELVHDTIHQLKSEGHTQVIVSHSIEDVLDLADRIVVMYQGRVADVVDAEDATRELLTDLITSGKE